MSDQQTEHPLVAEAKQERLDKLRKSVKDTVVTLCNRIDSLKTDMEFNQKEIERLCSLLDKGETNPSVYGRDIYENMRR